MKKNLIATLFLACSFFASRATHLMGGDLILYKSQSGVFVLKHIAYRDQLGTFAHYHAEYIIQKYDALLTQWTTIYQASPSTLDLDLTSATVMTGIPYGVEYNIYYDSSGTIDMVFAANGNGRYRITTYDCCRNHAILNLANPGYDGLTLTCEYEYDSSGTYVNSSPEFLAQPVIYGPINQAWLYNPLPFDADGDSLNWSLATPQDFDSLLLTNTPCIGYSTPPADPGGPFSLNNYSGELTWTPNLVGNYVASFQIDEYRNGAKIGSTIRDMQYVVISDSDSTGTKLFLPAMSGNSGINVASGANGQQYNYIVYTPGSALSFEVFATDQNADETLTLNANSALLLDGASNASFTSTATGNANEKKGTFTWTPSVTESKDFLVSVRANDGTFNKDFTVVLKRNQPTAITQTKIVNSITISPNPIATGQALAVEISSTSALQNSAAEIFDATGKVISKLELGNLNAGTHAIQLNTNLNAGFYFLKLSHSGGQLTSKKFVVQ
ncbi:MAG: hypothetical protein RL660_1157 [Bacteroidota bacterium]|jgi:hypothetical protein